MLLPTTRHRRSKKHGISNVIVVMLSLVLIVIVVANVILWSYQMNQLDLERMQEKITVSNAIHVTASSWSVAQDEFTVNLGSRMGGTYVSTRMIDDIGELFAEERIAGTSVQTFNPSSYVLNGATAYVSGNLADLTSSNDIHMSFRSHPNYEMKYQESMEVSSTTEIAYQDKAIIVFSPQVSAEFILIAAAEIHGSSTSYSVKARLTVNSTTFQETAYRIKDTTDWYPFSGLKRIALDQNQTYDIGVQYCTSDSRMTASIRNARILALSLKCEYSESEGVSTTGITNWQDKVTLELTPASSGDYLVIASANYGMTATNRDARIRLIQDDIVIHSDNVGRPRTGVSDAYTFGVIRKVTLDTTLHSFKIQYCSAASPGNAMIGFAHIAAIRLDQFTVNHYAEDEAESSPATRDVWYDKVANTYLAEDDVYLVLGSISFKSGSTGNSVGLDFQTESTSIQNQLVEHRASTDYEAAFFMTKQTLEAGMKTDVIRYLGESTSTRVRNARLISCRLPAFMQNATVEFAGNSNTEEWTELEWTVELASTASGVSTVFQLFDYASNQYPASGDGFMSEVVNATDVTKNQAVMVAPERFRDGSGNWTLRVFGSKMTEFQFELKTDWIEIETTTPYVYRVDIDNDFTTDLHTHPASGINGFEIFLRYNITSDSERLFLCAYNWTGLTFEILDIGGSQPMQNEWNSYAINVTVGWESYINANGTLLVKLQDEGIGFDQASVEIDFFGARSIINGMSLTLHNSGQYSLHIVAIWTINTTIHERHATDFFINSGEGAEYVIASSGLPEDSFMIKVVTERGNMAVFP